MEKLPTMSYREKFQKASQAVRSYQDRIPDFIANGRLQAGLASHHFTLQDAQNPWYATPGV